MRGSLRGFKEFSRASLILWSRPKHFYMRSKRREVKGSVNLRTACVVSFLTFLLGASAALGLPAFPGAEGEGSGTPGGRGGKVYRVTSLEDAGSGTLREACEAEGPRMVVLNVSGVIELTAPIEIRHPFITIAGQAAPGDGVCLKNHGLRVAADDVVIRYLRIRPGASAGGVEPGIAIDGAARVVIDHCSVSWTTGPAIAVTDHSSDVTLQWNMLAESLYHAETGEGLRGVGMRLAGGEDSVFSIHHNYFAHHYSGSPLVVGTGEAPGPILDFRNNVVYDWGQWAGDSANGPMRYNILGNAYKAGPSTPYETRARGFRFDSVESRIHGLENDLEGSGMVSGNNFFLWEMPKEYILRVHIEVFVPNDPFPAAPIGQTSAAVALKRVMAEAGATRPTRDAVDVRVASQYRLSAGGLVSDPVTAGGWPAYEMAPPPEDADADGMPDAWEREHGLSPQDAADHAGDADGDGYTNIEEYLNTADMTRDSNR